jgi:rubrerythrin
MLRLLHALRKPYVCRSCGTETSYPGTFRKCPVCGIKWG